MCVFVFAFASLAHHELGALEFAGYVREEILVLIICLLAVHVLQVLLGEVLREVVHDLLVLVLLGLDDTEEELGRNTEPKHSIDEDAHHLQVHQGLEQLAKERLAFLQELHIKRVELHLQLGLHFQFHNVALGVAVEFLGGESVIFEHFDVVGSLVLQADQRVNSILIVIANFEALHGHWHDIGPFYFLLVLADHSIQL